MPGLQDLLGAGPQGSPMAGPMGAPPPGPQAMAGMTNPGPPPPMANEAPNKAKVHHKSRAHHKKAGKHKGRKRR